MSVCYDDNVSVTVYVTGWWFLLSSMSSKEIDIGLILVVALLDRQLDPMAWLSNKFSLYQSWIDSLELVTLSTYIEQSYGNWGIGMDDSESKVILKHVMICS